MKVKAIRFQSDELEFQKLIDPIKIEEIIVDFDELINIINMVENEGLGKSLHKEAYDGIDYLGREVKYNSYCIYSEDNILYKYKFDNNFIPFNLYMKTINRDNKINSILK